MGALDSLNLHFLLSEDRGDQGCARVQREALPTLTPTFVALMPFSSVILGSQVTEALGMVHWVSGRRVAEPRASTRRLIPLACS